MRRRRRAPLEPTGPVALTLADLRTIRHALAACTTDAAATGQWERHAALTTTLGRVSALIETGERR